MPNHVTNKIEASKEVIDALYIDGHVDFNSVIPMPDDDDPIFTAERTDYGNGMVGYSFSGYSPMDWARGNWGSKWNAYDVDRVFDTEVRFDTAWSHPVPVVEALSRKFPDKVLTVSYADEDLGSNLGEYDIRNGEVLRERQFGGYTDPDALDFAAYLKYGKSYQELRKEWGEDDEDED